VKLRLPPRRQQDSEQRILPLINIVFLLLIFFMVAGQLSQSDAVRVEPPRSSSAADMESPLARILMAADGSVHINGIPVALADVTETARSLMAASAPDAIFVKAAGGVDARQAIALLAAIRAAGATGVRLVTQHRQSP
jgi:biopolymer transport protein ExbD